MVDERIARPLCWFNCRHRTLSGWVAAAVAPRWPIALARQASLHTWAAYRSTIRDQVVEVPWTDLLEQVDAARIEARLVWGQTDPVGDPAFAKAVTASMANVTVVEIPGADHKMPAAAPQLIVELLDTA